MRYVAFCAAIWLWHANDALVRPGNLVRESTMKRKILGGVLNCMALFTASVASADTTYYYVGSPYTYVGYRGTPPDTTPRDPAPLGTNITGSVTFNFDTSAGLYYLSGGNITDLQLTSGIYSLR
jgi:hypothetical protein